MRLVSLSYDLVSSKNAFPEKLSPPCSSEVKVGDVVEVSHESLMQIDLMSKVAKAFPGCWNL